MANYATSGQVSNALGNPAIGASGTQIVNDTQIAEILNQCDAMINLYLLLPSNTTTQPYASGLAKIETDLASMMILRIRHFRENNNIEGITSFWSIVPDFTPAHIRMLERIKQQLETQSYSYNINDGGRNL